MADNEQEFVVRRAGCGLRNARRTPGPQGRCASGLDARRDRAGWRALALGLALAAAPSLCQARTLFRQPLGPSRFFVLVTCSDADMADYCAAMLEKALCRSPGFTVLDAETVQKLKADEIMMARLNAADPSALREIAKKHSVDYQLTGKLAVDRKRLVNQYEGTALLTVEVIRTADGVKIGHVVHSREVGTVTNPGPLRELSFSAVQAAVTLVTNDVIGQLSLPGGFEPDSVGQVTLKRAAEHKLERPGAAVAVSDRGRCYVGANTVILQFDLAGGTRDSLPCQRPVSALALWPDERLLVSGHSDGSISAWDVASRQEVWRNRTSKKAIECLIVLPEGAWIAAGCADGAILVCERDSGRVYKQWSAHQGKPVRSLGFTYGGQFLLSAGADRYVQKWQVQTGQSVFSFREIATTSNRDRGDLRAAEFTREGNVVAVALKDIDIDLQSSTRTDTEYLCLHDCESCPPLEQYRFEAHDQAIDCLELCPTSCRFLASGSRDGKVKIWDMKTRTAIFEDYVGGWVQDMAFSPQANWFAVVTARGQGALRAQKNQVLRVWQIE